MLSTASPSGATSASGAPPQLIAQNTSPSVEHLSLLRADLRRITLLGDDDLDAALEGRPAIRSQADRQALASLEQDWAQLPRACPAFTRESELVPAGRAGPGGSVDGGRAARADRSRDADRRTGARGAGERAAAGGQPARRGGRCASSTSTPRKRRRARAHHRQAGTAVGDQRDRARRDLPGADGGRRVCSPGAWCGATRRCSSSGPTSWRRSPGGWRTTWSGRCRPPAWRSICWRAARPRPSAPRGRSSRGAPGSCARA